MAVVPSSSGTSVMRSSQSQSSVGPAQMSALGPSTKAYGVSARSDRDGGRPPIAMKGMYRPLRKKRCGPRMKFARVATERGRADRTAEGLRPDRGEVLTCG